jgi:hypothetical protein
MKKSSSPSMVIPALRRSSPSVSRTEKSGIRSDVRTSDIPSRFVASESSQGVDVQLNCLDDRHAVRLLDAVPDRAEPRDIGRCSDGGSVVVAVESAGGSTSSEPAQSSGRALDVDVAGTSCLALVLDVAGSPTFTPGCLLLHSIAAFSLMIAVLAPFVACARGRRSRPPRDCACGRRSALPTCATTTRSTRDRPSASWPSLCCGTSPAAPRSPRRREGARGAARSSGSAACPCQRR